MCVFFPACCQLERTRHVSGACLWSSVCVSLSLSIWRSIYVRDALSEMRQRTKNDEDMDWEETSLAPVIPKTVPLACTSPFSPSRALLSRSQELCCPRKIEQKSHEVLLQGERPTKAGRNHIHTHSEPLEKERGQGERITILKIVPQHVACLSFPLLRISEKMDTFWLGAGRKERSPQKSNYKIT